MYTIRYNERKGVGFIEIGEFENYADALTYFKEIQHDYYRVAIYKNNYILIREAYNLELAD